MRKILVSLVVMLSIAGGSLILVPRVSAQDLWQASLVPSTPELCGRFPQNMATRSLDKGVVTVTQSGLVEITLASVRPKKGVFQFVSQVPQLVTHN